MASFEKLKDPVPIVSLYHDRIDVEADVEGAQQDDGDEAPSSRVPDDCDRGEEEEGNQMGALCESGLFLEPRERSHKATRTSQNGMPTHSFRVEIPTSRKVAPEPTYPKPLVDGSLACPGSKVSIRACCNQAHPGSTGNTHHRVFVWPNVRASAGGCLG